MKVAYKIIPEGLFTGIPPPTVTETPRSSRHPEPGCQEKFTDEDLEKIGIYLDNALCDKSTGSKENICTIFYLTKNHFPWGWMWPE